MASARKIPLEDLLLMLSERLLSNVKSIRVNSMRQEPYVDYSEDEKSVLLTAELTGVRPENVRVAAGRDRIEIAVVGGSESFREVCRTPKIRPDSIRIRFNNSILEVSAERL